MNTKNILVSFLLIASVLLLTATASALEITNVKLDNVAFDRATLTAGDNVEVTFDLSTGVNETAKNVVVKVELGDETAEIKVGNLNKKNSTEEVSLTIEVPSDFKKNSLDKTMDFEISVEGEDADGDDLTTESFEGTILVSRSDYQVAIKSVTTNNIVEAGEAMSVNVVLRNTGYNDAEDVFVTVSVPELGIAKSVYFGDIVNVAYGDDESEDDEDAEDTVVGTISLNVPYSAKSGVYTLQVDTETDDSKDTATREITINNGVSDVAIKSGNDLVLLNPTNKLVVYTVKYLANEEVVVIPAASSKTVTIESSNSDFDVTVYNGEALLSTVKFTGASETTELTSPVFVLTVILAIVFLVLLVVLVVLLTKKPQKAEEFGESYY